MVSSDLRQRLAAICERLPGAGKPAPRGGGHDARTVGGRMFACIGSVQPGLSANCAGADIGRRLIEAGAGARAPGFHRSWIPPPDDVDRAGLRHRVRASCDLIRARLPETWPSTLPDRPPEPLP